MIPFAKAKTVPEGTALTIVTYGALVQRSLLAAKNAEQQQGINAAVIDLRTLAPYDWDSVARSVRKTNKLIVAHEDSRTHGFGAELAARVSEELFEYLDAPVRRVAALDTFVAYAPQLEDAVHKLLPYCSGPPPHSRPPLPLSFCDTSLSSGDRHVAILEPRTLPPRAV